MRQAARSSSTSARAGASWRNWRASRSSGSTMFFRCGCRRLANAWCNGWYSGRRPVSIDSSSPAAAPSRSRQRSSSPSCTIGCAAGKARPRSSRATCPITATRWAHCRSVAIAPAGRILNRCCSIGQRSSHPTATDAHGSAPIRAATWNARRLSKRRSSITEADQIAAFIAEPMVGASGGVIPPVAEYWPRIAEICRRHDIVLIADEVMTGFGRTGKRFAVEHWGVTPTLSWGAKD